MHNYVISFAADDCRQTTTNVLSGVYGIFIRVALWCTLAVGLGAAVAGPLSAPSGLSPTSIKATSFTLRWSAATGGVGGTSSYSIYRNGALAGTSITRVFAVTGLSPTTTYDMTVIARDSAGNISLASSGLSVTTSPDTTVPSKPVNLATSAITTTSFSLTWTDSTDNVGVSSYHIYRSGVLIGSTTTTSFNITGLAADVNHRITVRAVDAVGNLSAASLALGVRTLANPPSTPAALSAVNIKASSFTLKWTAATGGVGGIVAYDIYRNAIFIASRTTRSFAILGLAPVSTYTMTVVSRDAAGNVSAPSAPLTVTTISDTTRPTAPSGLSATDITSTSFEFMWTPSTDNVAVTSYDVYKGGALAGNTLSPNYVVTGLAPSSVSSMKVKAKDAAGNISSFSAAMPVVTSAAPNALPTVVLSSPVVGSTFTGSASITLTAMAVDADGTILKVEFFEGVRKLGESSTPSSPGIYSLPYTWSAVGLHVLTARATDNRNAMVESVAVPIRLLANLPYTTDFESESGYVPGPLNNQHGWTVSAGAAQVTTVDAAHGEQSVVLEAGASAAFVDQEFGVASVSMSEVFFDFLAKPVAGFNTEASTVFDIDNARLAFVLNGIVGQFAALDGDGAGAGTWKILSPQLALISGYTTSGWQRITVRLDYTTKTWDLHLNGQLIAASLKFRFNAASFFSGISFKGHAAGDVKIDDIYIGVENPLFADTDRDGLDDDWEQKYLGTLSHGANDDPGVVSRTLLQSLQANLSPWPSAGIAEGLRGWYRADLGVARDAANAVSRWTDLSGNGLHVVQGELESQPTWNPDGISVAKATIDFDGLEDLLSTVAKIEAQNGATDVSVYVVVRPFMVQPFGGIIDGSDDDTVNFRMIGAGAGSNSYTLEWLGTALVSANPVQAAGGQTQLIAFEKIGTVVNGYLNGTKQSSRVVESLMQTTPHWLAIGNNSEKSNPFRGKIAEILIYNRALTEVERLELEESLKVSYGLSNSGADSDGNGMPDTWEIANFGHIGVDPNADPDQDGKSNRQEYLDGTDPKDYFNGDLPQIVPMVYSTSTPTGDYTYSVLIVSELGQPMINAPVNFRSTEANMLLRAGPESEAVSEVEVRTDIKGIATVYLQQI